MKKHIISVIMLVVMLNITSCGYFLYPERVGQSSGKLDSTVIILDAIGLLLGVIPGVVAFAVDLTTGTIYLSPGQKSAIEKHGRIGMMDDINMKPVDKSEMTIDKVATAKQLSEILGRSVNANDIEFYKPDGVDSIAVAKPIASI